MPISFDIFSITFLLFFSVLAQQEAYEQFLREKQMVDEAVRQVIEANERYFVLFFLLVLSSLFLFLFSPHSREEEERMRKQAEMQGYISQYMRDREAFRENEKRKMEEEACSSWALGHIHLLPLNLIFFFFLFLLNNPCVSLIRMHKSESTLWRRRREKLRLNGNGKKRRLSKEPSTHLYVLSHSFE